MAIPKQKPLGITANSAARIKRVCDRVDSTPRGSTSRPQSNMWTFGVVSALVTTAIPTGTFAAPSSTGRAQIYHKDSSGAWVPSGDPVKVYNRKPLTASVAVGKGVDLAWMSGDWFMIQAECQ